jgi:hypothetical protein
MPSLKAWVKRPVGLIKSGRSASAVRESTLIKVDNFSEEQISIIDLNHLDTINLKNHEL